MKGYDESLLDGVDEHWTESRHQVFRKVQDHAHSAMLHFFSPTLPELAIRSFVVSVEIFLNMGLLFRSFDLNELQLWSRISPF